MSVGLYPKHRMTERQLCDLALLAEGTFTPVKTFLNKSDYESVVLTGRLKNKKIWPIPIILDLEGFEIGQTISLTDIYGTIYATFSIEEVYIPDKNLEALNIYGTTSLEHPGVEYLFNKTANKYVSGKLRFIRKIEWHDFSYLRHSRKEILAKFKKIKSPIIAFQTRNPIHKAHAELVKLSAKKIKAHIFIQPVVGPTKTGDIDHRVRVKTYEAVINKFKNATLSLLPLAMRMAGPKEAILHAIIRRNYGATHFIVGRDHAGPGSDSNGKPFYDAYEAQQALLAVSEEIGIIPVFSQEIVYVEKEKKYLPIDKVPKKTKYLQLSGTNVRKLLKEGKDLPDWFTFDEVKKILKDSMNRKKGLVILFTGMSGAGKTTLAKNIAHYIDYTLGRNVSILDGDEVRNWLSEGLGFSEIDRKKNVKRVGRVALEISKHGGVAICALIAPYESVRTEIKEMIKPHADFIEIYVHAPLNIVQKRDMKGLYEKAKKDKTVKMSGSGDIYEIPKNPHLSIDTSKLSIKKSIEKIINYLKTFLS